MRSRFLIIFCLIFAGELIFSLPFHVARFFRPTLLAVFDLSHTDLGDVFAVFGITAMLFYFPGGALADKFSARKLMTLSLFATALGGLYMATIPSAFGLAILFGYWGITSIFLFWAAMIKATRDSSDATKQGSAFGILDGGRGLVAATVATLAVFLLSTVLPGNLTDGGEGERYEALQSVIYFYVGMTSLAGILVWIFVPDTQTEPLPSQKVLTQHSKDTGSFLNQAQARLSGLSSLVMLLKNRAVMLQALIVVCAYCAYKSLDNYGVYAVEILGMNDLEAAKFTSYAAYLRPVSAVLAGFLADRFFARRIISISFVVLLVVFFLLSVLQPGNVSGLIIYGSIFISFSAVYALRGIYFALLEEAKVATHTTGAAVGLVSLIGFTPDIFFASLTGRIMDASVGLQGFQNYFLLMAGFSLMGMFASFLFSRMIKVQH